MALVLSVYDRGVQQQLEQRREALQSAIGEANTVLAGAFGELRTQTTGLHDAAQSLQREAVVTDEKCSAVSDVLAQAKIRLEASAGTSEGFSRSLAHVADSANDAAQQATQARRQGSEARDAVSLLVDSAKRIDSVVKLISEIAEQTNLLALNATIEAARAGEAGRGFSVVAQEVKSLASQTAKATDDITAQVAAMQTATTRAAAQISSIVEAVERMDASVGSIVEAGRGQEEATRNMTADTAAVVQAFDSVTDVLQASLASAAHTRSAAENVTRNSSDIDRHTEQMREMIRAFFAKVA
jgi:methyl-accepting chemotaxis protein